MRNHALRPNIQAEELPSQPEDLDNPDESLNNNEADESSTQRARCYSKTPRDAQPKSTTMKYYPPCWQAMLKIAKNNMRKHIALVNAFPWRDRDLKEATLILKNTIMEYERINGNSLDPGFFNLSLTY